MTLNEEGLVLGAGTVLINPLLAANTAELALKDEERILALLSIAYRKAVDPCVLGKIRRAWAAWREGEACLALIHLAQTDLGELAGEEAGFPLFAADQLLASGINPRDLLKACDIDSNPLDLLKAGFNPDEPRVPAGNPDGGQWTYGGDTSTTEPRTTGSGAGAREAAPTNYRRVKEPPADARAVVPPDGVPIADPKSGKPLVAPPNADFRQVYAAGQAIAASPLAEQYRQARAAVAQEGIYDFQRDVSNKLFYSAYTPAANYAVGVYMAGAGYSLSETLSIAKLYAFEHSSNYSIQDRDDWITRGWTDAHSGRWR
jgi:hypothetical protein